MSLYVVLRMTDGANPVWDVVNGEVHTTWGNANELYMKCMAKKEDYWYAIRKLEGEGGGS